jgi:putative transposase
MNLCLEQKRQLVESGNPLLSIRQQCQLLSLPRSSYYFSPQGLNAEDLFVMKEIDKIYTKRPFYGSPKITDALRKQGFQYNHKRIARLMRIMGIQALFPKRNLSKQNQGHCVFPYLLRNTTIAHIDHVWSTDITYIPMRNGFAYLVAVIDWYSRYVLSWELSNTLDVYFCVQAVEQALSVSRPEIFNTDQGSQFTSELFVNTILSNQIALSMDSKGRALDNVFIERLWRSLKYEDIYIKDYETMLDLFRGLTVYFQFYNYERSHQSLGYRTPAEVYFQKGANR